MKKLTTEQAVKQVLSFILSLFIGALLFKWCWNYTVPEFFGLPELTYWKSFVFSYLVRLIGSYLVGSLYWQRNAERVRREEI